MRQRDLELRLARVPPHPRPRADLEQYATPAPIASDLLYRALALGDVDGARVLDLGCGTGVFAIGAVLLGAEAAVGVDVDPASVGVAREAARAVGAAARASWIVADVRRWRPRGRRFDVAIQNPPFGAQTPGADRPFLDAALAAARVAYSMHLTTTGRFVVEYAQARRAVLTHAWDYEFPLRHQFAFQEKAVRAVPVTAFRFLTG